MRSDRRAVGSAVVQRHDAGVFRRIERTFHRNRVERVGYQQPTLALVGARRKTAAGGVIGDLWDRGVEARGLGFPCRLLDLQAITRRDDRGVNRDLDDLADVTHRGVAIRANKVAKGGSSALFAARSNLPSVVNAISSTRVVPPVEIDCLIVDVLRSMTLSVLSPSPP